MKDDDVVHYITDFASYCEFQGCGDVIPNGNPKGSSNYADIKQHYCSTHAQFVSLDAVERRREYRRKYMNARNRRLRDNAIHTQS